MYCPTVFAGTAGPTRRDVRSTNIVNDWGLAHSFTISWYMNIADSSYVAVCYECLWLIDHSRVVISWFTNEIGRILTDVEDLRRVQTTSAGGRRCEYACLAPPGKCSAGRNLWPLIGCRTAGGGSGGHTERAREIGAIDMPAGGVWTAYIKQDLSASQLVAAVPVTGSLVCICWFNHRNTTGTVRFPRRQKIGDTDWTNWTEFRVWLQMFAGDCSMDADYSMLDNREGNTFGMNLLVPWDAPESVVDVSSAGVVPLRDLSDGMGLVGRQKDATESRILQGRDPRSICVLIPDGRGFDQNYHDVTIVEMGNLPESHVSMSELAELIHRWPPAVINHMTWRQREIELMRKMARMKFRLQNMMPCTFCGYVDMYRHVAPRNLELAQLWRCPVSWCTVWKGTPQDLMDHVLNDHNVPEGIRRVSLEMLFPLWTVTRHLYEESLSAKHSGISNDVLLFSELGLSLVHHYRVHRSGRPHIMFRGKYLAQLRAVLPLRRICLIILVRSWSLMNSRTVTQIWRTSYHRQWL